MGVVNLVMDQPTDLDLDLDLIQLRRINEKLPILTSLARHLHLAGRTL